jgi:hypothetical protein
MSGGVFLENKRIAIAAVLETEEHLESRWRFQLQKLQILQQRR